MVRFDQLILSLLCVNIRSAGVPYYGCSKEIIDNAASQGFFSFVYNCLHNTNDGSQECLRRFIAENAAGNLFPITGDCRDVYQAFVRESVPYIPNCSQSELKFGAIPDNYDCMIQIGDNAVDRFYQKLHLYPVKFCSAAEVRAYAKLGAFAASFVDLVTGSTNQWDQIKFGTACDFCYINWFLYSALEVSERNPFYAECLTPTDKCLGATVTMISREKFLQCAGYDILEPGPMCTPAHVAQTDMLIPSPYYTFTYCANNPTALFCKTVDAHYLTQIQAETNIDCLACYTEFRADIEGLAVDGNACETDVFSAACIDHLGDALIAFETCSGSILNVSPPQ